MKIVQVGEVIQRILKPIPLLDSSLEEHFHIKRPNCLASFEAICKHGRSLFLLQSHHKEMQLKGQMVYLEVHDHLLFIGSPWVTDIADLKKLDLSLNDFPIWDSVSDYLFLVQTKNTALADAKKLTAKLTNQRTELRSSEEQLKLALDAVEEGLWDWNLVTGEVYRSPHWFTMLGYNPEDLENDIQVTNRLIHPEDQPLMQQRLIAHLNGETPYYEAEVRLLSKSGEWRWILDRGKLVSRDSQGKSLRMVGTHLDITERKRAEESLQKQYQRVLLLKQITEEIRQSLQLEKILQTAVTEVQRILQADRVLIFQMSPNGSGKVVQEAVVPGWSVTLDQDINDPCLQEGYLDFYREGRITAISDADKAGLKPCHLEFLQQFQVKANLVVPILVREDLWGLLIAHQCAQPRQWTELELDLLKHIADQMGIALTQAQLLAQETYQSHLLIQQNEELSAAKQAAEAANIAKSNFLAVMSHEIRTPLSAIIGMTRLLLDTPLKPEQLDCVETIRNSSDMLLTIINDILDFSKIESGKLELEAQPFNLRTCIEETLDLLAPQAASKGIELMCHLELYTPTLVIGDIIRLRQILWNLVSNAVKFTNAGEVVVAITTQQPILNKVATASQQPCYEIQFAISDTGIGIAREHLDRLFKPFSQVDTSMTRRYGGTGLGLAISKRLCELMGGRMWVKSAVSKGSTFYFTVMLQVQPSAIENSWRVEPELVRKRLLLAVDNANLRKSLTLQLQTLGLHVQAMEIKAATFDWMQQQNPFDVAILDTDSPLFKALNLTEQIRSIPKHKNLPLVMLSSKGKSTLDVKQISSEFTAFLHKPLRQYQLHNTLLQIVRGVWSTRVNSQTNLPSYSRLPTPNIPTIDAQFAQNLPLKILLVEDVLVNQKIALKILERFGYQADVANNGYEALKALQQQLYDVVFMDIQMPEMDGLETTRRIRAELSRTTQPQIIAMTAHAREEDRQECLQVGMNDYISKPISPETLVTVLKRLRTQQNKPLLSRNTLR
jgi:PAS domain S-box-containing protein